MGTNEGLCRYDGYTFRKYKHNPSDSNSLSDNGVFCMIEDSDGKLWIGTRRTGITVFDPKTEKFRRYNYKKGDSTTINHYDVRALCMDNDGDIWVATGRGINKYDRKKDQFRQYNSGEYPDCPHNIFSLCIDKTNLMWIGSHDPEYYYSFNKATQKFIPEKMAQARMPLTQFLDDSNYIWQGTRNGLYSFDLKNKGSRIYQYDPKDPHSVSGNDFFLGKVFVDSKYRVWAATMKDGLSVFERDRQRFSRFYYDARDEYSISSNSIRGIMEDPNGLIWIGTEDGGLNIYNPLSSIFTVYKSNANNSNSLAGDYINYVYEDKKGRLWIAIGNTGLDVFDPVMNAFSHYVANDKHHLISNAVTSICEDGSGKLWITTDGAGGQLFDENTNTYSTVKIPSEPWMNCSMLDSKDRLWIGANNPGLAMYDPDSGKFTKTFGRDDKDISTFGLTYTSMIFEDDKCNIWLGSLNKGVTLLDPDKNEHQHFGNDPNDSLSLSHDVIYSIIEDRNKNIWIGTMMGLNKFDRRTNKFKRYYMRDGLPSDAVKGILEDKSGNLWLATTNGLCKFNPIENTFFTYDITDGLPSNEFSGAICKGKDGRFYLGTSRGLVSFRPEMLVTNSKKPGVVLTKLTVLNKPWPLPQEISFTNELILSYREYFFSVEFSALDFSASGKNKYAYKLEGFNSDWVELGNKREATFTNLDAGDYILKVKGSNNHGVWSDEKALLKITITPPWWKTKLFYTVCIATLFMLLFILIRWRERKLQTEKKDLKQKIEIATSEIRLQKEVIEDKNKEVLDSIHYARRIQQALLASDNLLGANLPEYFVLHKPKDIVSGDFYWATRTAVDFYLCIADCTGHGVPGAFMSLLNISFLNEAINEKSMLKPEKVLDHVRNRVIRSLSLDGSDEGGKDGMDCILCKFNFSEMKLEFSAANNPLWLIRNGQLKEFVPDKMPVGKSPKDNIPFTLQEISLEKGDVIYALTDGYADQFGGKKGKKFKYSRLKEIILSCHSLPMKKQLEVLEQHIDEWKGVLEQVDDILIIGIRV